MSAIISQDRAELDIDSFDRQLAATLMRRVERDEAGVANLIATVSAAVRQGHACLELGASDHHYASADGILVGVAADITPLVHDGNRLYLRRYYDYERAVAAQLSTRARCVDASIDWATAIRSINRLLSDDSGQVVHEQQLALLLALRSPVSVICGGPGTGKTWTVLRLLALLLERAVSPLRIALAAPTGKAAARLGESVAQGLAHLPVDMLVAAQISTTTTTTTTLHRLLGRRPLTTATRYNSGNRLPFDVLVVDEASMVDLPNMARLLDALPVDARLILLGDADQLASVEAGSVLAELHGLNPDNRYSASLSLDLTRAGIAHVAGRSDASALSDAVVTLRRSHRFADHGSIGGLTRAVRMGDADAVLEVLHAGIGVRWLDDDPASREWLYAEAVADRSVADATNSPMELLNKFASFRILCALRDGPRGARGLNTDLVRRLQGLALWQPVPIYFPGAPILITANDHAIGRYNGDNGVVWPDAAGAPRVWFDDVDGPRDFAPAQLPEHELAYALTVHKAQGSEFERVAVLLPAEPHPLLSRQWLYTAVSRAREHVTVIGSEAVIRAAIQRDARRWSGLGATLRNPPHE